MKTKFRAHPFMIASFMKPFLFILIIPVIKGIVQYLLYKKVSGILSLEIVAICFIVVIAVVKWKCFFLSVKQDIITISSGFVLKTQSVIRISRISSIETTQNPIDALFGSVTYFVNTEAGKVGKPDFKFKMNAQDSKLLSRILYGGENRIVVKFSLFKIAAMAATTSSAFTGLVVGVPIVNKIGDLIGIALSEILFNKINKVSEKVITYFPPIVNTITLMFLFGYAIAFLFSFFSLMNFRLLTGKEKIEIRRGFLAHRTTVFNKSCVNDVCIEQSPLMRLFKRFTLHVAVGGYGNARAEKAVIIPCAKQDEIAEQFSMYFSFLAPQGRSLRPARGNTSLQRFLWIPNCLAVLVVTAAIVLVRVFPYFDRLIVFLMAISLLVVFYIVDLSLFNYKKGTLKLGDNIYVRATVGFRTRELYCSKNKVGLITLRRTPADIRLNTCKVRISIRSESADHVLVRNINYNAVQDNLRESFKI